MNRISTFLLQAVFAILICFQFSSAQAQFKTKQVIVASGGAFGDPNNYVRIGAYNPNTKIYTVFDSVRAASTKTVITDGKFAYLTADTFLVKYDLDNYTRLAVSPQFSTGLSYLATYNKYVLATRGYGASSNFVKVYNSSDLSEAFTITGISDQAAGIVVVGDTAYVAVPGPFNKDTGTIAVIDLSTMQLKREIMLDSMGAQVGKLFTDGTNIYAVSSKRSIITTYEIATGAIMHSDFSNFSSGSGVALAKGKLFTDFAYSGIGTYDVSTGAMTSLAVNYNKMEGISSFTNFVSGAALDTLNQQFYVTATDFISNGATYIFDMNGNVLDTFAVGVSPEALAVDYRSTVGIQKQINNNLTVNAYPNPAKNTLHIITEGLTDAVISITDINGKTLLQQNAENKASAQVNIQQLLAGLYIVNVRSAQGYGVQKFIKL